MKRASRQPSVRRVFDEAYYATYYKRPGTRAHSREELAFLIDHITAYLAYLDIPVKHILDVGCGLGWWRDCLKTVYPSAPYQGIETSDYLCREYGWTQSSIADFRSRRKYDLVICQSVLQYLDSATVRSSLANLARLCRGGLYLELVTREDWEQNCNRRSTDGNIYLRSAAWYRREVAKHFTNCGGGLFLPHGSPVVMYELERL